MIVNCDNCYNKFNKCLSEIKRVNHNFCSHKCMGEFRKLDLTKKTFDKLKVLKFKEVRKSNKSKHSVWECECSCGKIIDVYGGDLISGHSTKCSSCKGRKYVGEISGSYYSSIKYSALSRNILFEITQLDIWEKFLEQDGKCVYSGQKLIWQDGARTIRGIASVDRIDSRIGYIKDNIQIVHKDVNWIKLNHSEKHFLEICQNISIFDRNYTEALNYIPIKKHKNWSGYGEISGGHWCKIKESAVSRNIDFSISIENCWDLYLKQGGVCALSGLPIGFESCQKKKSEERTSSLDRINNNLGYSIDNIQWLHKEVNMMKSDFIQEYFIELCITITNYQKDKNGR